MKNITVDFDVLETPREVHDCLREAIGSAEYYGSNLDALYDVLTTFSEDVCFVLRSGVKAFE